MPPEELDQYQIKGHQTYHRHFDNGIVLVNPSMETDESIQFERTYIDPRNGSKVRSVEIPPHSGKILLIDF